jgi:hypothetical protein
MVSIWLAVDCRSRNTGYVLARLRDRCIDGRDTIPR